MKSEKTLSIKSGIKIIHNCTNGCPLLAPKSQFQNPQYRHPN